MYQNTMACSLAWESTLVALLMETSLVMGTSLSQLAKWPHPLLASFQSSELRNLALNGD